MYLLQETDKITVSYKVYTTKIDGSLLSYSSVNGHNLRFFYTYVRIRTNVNNSKIYSKIYKQPRKDFIPVTSDFTYVSNPIEETVEVLLSVLTATEDTKYAL